MTYFCKFSLTLVSSLEVIIHKGCMFLGKLLRIWNQEELVSQMTCRWLPNFFWCRGSQNSQKSNSLFWGFTSKNSIEKQSMLFLTECNMHVLVTYLWENTDNWNSFCNFVTYKISVCLVHLKCPRDLFMPIVLRHFLHHSFHIGVSKVSCNNWEKWRM